MSDLPAPHDGCEPELHSRPNATLDRKGATVAYAIGELGELSFDEIFQNLYALQEKLQTFFATQDGHLKDAIEVALPVRLLWETSPEETYKRLSLKRVCDSSKRGRRPTKPGLIIMQHLFRPSDTDQAKKVSAYGILLDYICAQRVLLASLREWLDEKGLTARIKEARAADPRHHKGKKAARNEQLRLPNEKTPFVTGATSATVSPEPHGPSDKPHILVEISYITADPTDQSDGDLVEFAAFARVEVAALSARFEQLSQLLEDTVFHQRRAVVQIGRDRVLFVCFTRRDAEVSLESLMSFVGQRAHALPTAPKLESMDGIASNDLYCRRKQTNQRL